MTAFDPRLSSLLAALGRGGDSIVAHINPREAALLHALGGSGTTNPKTGLPEFDDGGGGGSGYNEPAPPPSSLTPAEQSAAFGTGAFSAPGLQPAGVLSQPGASVNLPEQYAIDPSLVSQWNTTFSRGAVPDTGFVGTNPLQYGANNPAFEATAGNPNFSVDPTTGYATLTPQGTAALQQDYATSLAEAQKNYANNQKGIGAFLGTPMGALSILSLPFAVGGGVAALGGIGGALDATGGALAAGSEAGALSDSALAGAMAADVPSAGAGAGTAAGAGAFGGATPELASIGANATVGTMGLADASGFLAPSGLVDPLTGAVDASVAASAFPSGLDAGLGGTVGGLPAAATPDLTATAAPTMNSVFGGPGVDLGSTALVTDPQTIATSGAAGGGAVGSTLPLPPDFVSEAEAVAQNGGTPFDYASAESMAQAMSATPIDFSGADTGFLGKVGSFFGKAGDAVVSQLEKNPIGALASVGGLAANLLKGNSQPPQQTALNNTANQLSAQGQALTQQILSGKLPLPGQEQLQAVSQQLLQQAQTLQQQATSGQLPQEGASQLLAQANQLAAQSETLRAYMQTGTLPPGMQAGLDTAAAAAKASIRSAYAQRGMSGSSAEAQDVANVDTNKATQGANIAMQLFAQGMTEAQAADGAYTSLVNASTSLLQLSTQEASLGVSAQNAVNATSATLLNLALNATGLGANINQTLVNEALQQDQQLQQSLAAFAAALAGGTGKLALVNVGGTGALPGA